ncbi:MAG: hypothetical protein U5L96_09845 [Owenweeksia sp.]|nr:hypothetical protein [Owenweeksia sp.]
MLLVLSLQLALGQSNDQDSLAANLTTKMIGMTLGHIGVPT